MKVILFGASGMVGGGVLRHCLKDPKVETVLSVGRRPSGVADPKLRELTVADLFHLADHADELRGYDACFFCAGVSSVGMSEDDYRRLTYDMTIRVAEVLEELNPNMTFCYVSGQGTDSTAAGRTMWARVKGETENKLLSMGFSAYMFRPGVIQPAKGVPPQSKWIRAVYVLMTPIFPLLHAVAPNSITTTEAIARAMIRVSEGGPGPHVLEVKEINA